ncbi:MAG: hypothetical protein J6P60_03130, partial [Lachnospiraceae bacterium]|nr:hypothetical protein [Lachnospiraceae bacterium]
MSLLIKGMEIPTGRGEYGLILYVYSDGTAAVEGEYCCFEGEPFEAVPIPPGRLIDADVLAEYVCQQSVWLSETAIHTFLGILRKAPTIIDA